MKVLIDENLPQQLKQMLSGHQTATVQDMGWAGIKNGELLRNAEAGFDVLLTADKNLKHQQNVKGLHLIIIVFPSNRLQVVEKMVPHLEKILDEAVSGTVVEL